eukprot:6212798-Pleurochrysis_carterae.AAC.3
MLSTTAAFMGQPTFEATARMVFWSAFRIAVFNPMRPIRCQMPAPCCRQPRWHASVASAGSPAPRESDGGPARAGLAVRCEALRK